MLDMCLCDRIFGGIRLEYFGGFQPRNEDFTHMRPRFTILFASFTKTLKPPR